MNSLSRPKRSPSHPNTPVSRPDAGQWYRKHHQVTVNKGVSDKTQLLPPFSELSLADKNYIMNNYSVSNNSDEDLEDKPCPAAGPGSNNNFSIFNDMSSDSSCSSISSVLRHSSSSSSQSTISSISSSTCLPDDGEYQCAPRYSALASLHNDSLNRRLYFSKTGNDNVLSLGSSIGSNSPVAANSPLLEQKHTPRPLPRTPKKTKKSYGALGIDFSNTPRKRIIQPTFHFHEPPSLQNTNVNDGAPSNNGKTSPIFAGHNNSGITVSKKRLSMELDGPRVVYSSNQVYPSNNSDDEDFDYNCSPNPNNNNNSHFRRRQRCVQPLVPFTPTHRSRGSTSSIGSVGSASPTIDFLNQSPGRRCSPRHTELIPSKSSLKTHPPQNPYVLPPSMRPASQQGKRPLPCIVPARSGEKLGFYSKQDLVRRESDGCASSASTARRVASYQKHSRRTRSTSSAAITGGSVGSRGHRRNKSAAVVQLPVAPMPPVRKRVAWAAVLEW